MIVALQLLSCFLGIASAASWFGSARVGWVKSDVLPDLPNGAIAISLDDGTMQSVNLPKQARLNAWGAALAASSVSLQVVVTLIQALPSS